MRPGQAAAPLAPSIVAGELIEVRASSAAAIPTVMVGATGERIAVGRCTRMVVTSSGPIAATIDPSSAKSVRFGVRVLPPSLVMWTRGGGWAPCDGRRVEATSLAAIAQLRTAGGSTLAPDAVVKIVRSRYLAGVERCHERLLRTDRMATGRVTVRFTVGPAGGVVAAVASGVEPALDTCIESLMLKWRFGAPKDAQGKPTTEDVDGDIVLGTR